MHSKAQHFCPHCWKGYQVVWHQVMFLLSFVWSYSKNQTDQPIPTVCPFFIPLAQLYQYQNLVHFWTPYKLRENLVSHAKNWQVWRFYRHRMGNLVSDKSLTSWIEKSWSSGKVCLKRVLEVFLVDEVLVKFLTTLVELQWFSLPSSKTRKYWENRQKCEDRFLKTEHQCQNCDLLSRNIFNCSKKTENEKNPIETGTFPWRFIRLLPKKSRIILWHILGKTDENCNESFDTFIPNHKAVQLVWKRGERRSKSIRKNEPIANADYVFD